MGCWGGCHSGCDALWLPVLSFLKDLPGDDILGECHNSSSSSSFDMTSQLTLGTCVCFPGVSQVMAIYDTVGSM